MSFTQNFKPANFSDLVFDASVDVSLLQTYANCNSNNSLILFGTYGTGKTATAEVIQLERFKFQNVQPNAFSIDGAFWDKHCLSQIKNWCSLQMCNGATFPSVIINEVDQLKKADQLALRSFLDNFSSFGNVILTTNFLCNVDNGLINRCTSVAVPIAKTSLWVPRVQSYLKQQHVNLPNTSVLPVLNATNGTIRDIGRAVDQLVLTHQQASSKPVQKPQVKHCGTP